MTVLIVQFSLLAAAIVVAGTYLAKYADVIGARSGIGGTVAGLLLLALATSLPELVTDCSAARLGAADIAVGDLFGSSLFNLLILAVLDASSRKQAPALSSRSAAHALSAVGCIVLTAIPLLAILLEDPLRLGRLGSGTLAVAFAYVVCVRMVFFDQHYQMQVREATEEPPVELAAHVAEVSMRFAVVGYVVAAAAILVTGPFLARTADRLAVASGLGGTFVGTTLVALTTALPEISTTRAAFRLGAFDMAVGNIFGSNSFNMVILLPVDAFYAGNLLAEVAAVHAVTATAVIIVTSVATLGLLYRAEKRLLFIEYDAALVILLVLAALYLVYRVGPAAG